MPSLALPASLDEALDALLADADARPMAGGVGLLLRAAFGERLPERVVAVGRLPELRTIEAAGDGIRVGAAVTLAELARSPLVRERFPILAAAAGMAANPGVRTTATIGGNLLDRPGGSDLVAAALALAAEAIWAGPGAGPTRSPLRASLEPATDDARPRLLVAIVVEAAPDGWGFERLTTRGTSDRAAATVAVTTAAAGGEPAVAAWATSIAERPIRLARSARAVLDEASDEALRRAVDDDLGAIPLADDLRASGAYRRRVLPVLLRRAVAAAGRGR
ncbi:MAG TPA: FAD binding domain-containing protein [Candidatus Limnocylindrales bacterium]|nr:FAD binding domain-containing protein [Candidatus Limnocylindrales bacterium]